MKQTIFMLTMMVVFGTAQAGLHRHAPLPGGKVTDQISGFVKQSSSNRPLREVTVTVYEDNQQKVKTIVTDEDGSFGLNTLRPGTYKLVFQKDGYRKVVRDKVVVKTEGGIRIDVEMDESIYELSPSLFHFF